MLFGNNQSTNVNRATNVAQEIMEDYLPDFQDTGIFFS